MIQRMPQRSNGLAQVYMMYKAWDSNFFWSSPAWRSVLSLIIYRVLDSPYCIFVWIIQGSLLLADQPESIPLWTEAVGGVVHVKCRLVLSLQVHPFYPHRDTCYGSWWQHPSSLSLPKCHKEVGHRTSQAVLVLQDPLTSVLSNCNILASTGTAQHLSQRI